MMHAVFSRDDIVCENEVFSQTRKKLLAKR